MVGIGGTGVVTVAQILGTAAMLDGKHVRGLDQTGLAQKGGPVVSDIRIFERAIERASNTGVGTASVDAYLGFDLLGAADAQATSIAADRERTVAVVSTSQIADRLDGPRPVRALHRASARRSTRSRRTTRASVNVYLDAAGAGRGAVRRPHAGQHVLLGAACQARRSAAQRGRDRAGDRAQRRGGRRRRSPRSAGAAPSSPRPTPWRGDDPSAGAGRGAPAPRRPARGSSIAAGADSELRAAARGPRARAGRLPERAATPRATPTSCPRVRAAERRSSAAHRAHRGRTPAACTS